MSAESPFDLSHRLRRDIGRHMRGAFLLVAIGLTLGVALMPRGDELLLIHVRNHDIDQARRVLAEGASSGLSTVSSVVAHGELYLLEGRVDEALLDLEGFVATHRDNADAWRRLARLYQYAQRLDDQTRALAEVYRLEPSPELARQLVVLYRWTGDEAREATLLRALVTGGGAAVDETLRSARLEAALGRLDVALATMEQLAARDPNAFEYDDLDLFVSLLVDAGRSATLGERVQRLPLVVREPATLTQLAVSMGRRGWTEPAVQLFAAPRGVDLSPALLAGRARAAVGSGAAPEILRGLLDIHHTRALADEPLDAAVRLALSLGDFAAVDQLFARRAGAPAPALVGLVVGEAVAHDDRTRAQQLISKYGDEGLAESPVLALELAVERDDHERALYWIERFDAAGSTDPLEVAAVAQIEAGLGLEVQAFERLARLIPTGHAPDWALSDFASLAADLSRVDEALRLLAPGPTSPVSPERRRAWAALAASEHRSDLLKAWLARGSIGPRDAAALQGAYYLLGNRGDLGVAAGLAERLFAVRGTSDDLVLLAQALIAAGRPADALVPLRASGLREAKVRVAYDAALARAVEARWAAGERASIIDDVEALAGADLDPWLSVLVESAKASGRQSTAAALIARADGGLASVEDRRRTDRVRALVELAAPADVLLPELRRLAHESGEGWVSVYDEHLAAASRTGERIELWTRVGLEASAPFALRRAAASRLVDLKAPAAAADIFERLAADAAPGESDLQQLLYLWGTTPGDRQVEWLMARLRRAPLGERAAWMTYVIAAGAAARIVAEFPELPAEAPEALAVAWLDAHRASGDGTALRRALADTIAWADASNDTLRHAGRIALAEGLTDVAAAGFRLVAAREPEDLEAARWAGTLAFYERRTGEARQFLTVYDALGGDEAEPIFQLGELAREDERPADAHRYYERALQRLTDGGTEGVARPLLANVLVRLDARSRAIGVFEALLHDTPGNHHVRADFASALLRWGASDHAWRVLEAQPRLSPPAAADEAGARRLDLLRLQVLTVEGRYAGAHRLLESLEARFPADVDVRLARASFDAGRGRRVQADDQYVAVLRDAPDREDVAALVRARDQELSPHASLQLESRSVSEAWTAASTLVSVEGRLSRQVPVTMVAERLDLDARQVLGADGRIVPLTRTLTRFEAGLIRPLAPGTLVSAAVFGTDSGVGAGATFQRHDLHGAWKATAERGRPFWELVESVAGDGRKDRLGVQRDWRFSADAAGWVGLDSNRYRLSSGASATTTALTLGLVRTVKHAAPTLTLQYGIDKEHVRAATLAVADDGRVFAPIPLVSREVHLVGAVTRFPVRRLWDVEASAGYTADRFGGRGSFLTARATPNPGARLGLDLWGERRLYSLSTTQQALRGGARLTVRF